MFQLTSSYQVGILGNASDFNEADPADNTSYDNMDRRRMMIAFDMRYECMLRYLCFLFSVKQAIHEFLSVFTCCKDVLDSSWQKWF